MINVNYRYVEGELNYLFDNSDMVALLHERPYAAAGRGDRAARRRELKTTVVAMPDPSEPGSDADISSYDGVSGTTPWPARARPSATSARAAATTSTSSTPAAPPASPRA